jgi:predicted dithiol-disulfide oxidoreductase (DUF899 family)
MTTHRTATREEWRAARLELLEQEKELTRRSDELSRQRLELPRVRIDKDYLLDTADGPKTLADLFDGRSQLIVYHFMFGPDWDEGCPSCSLTADGFDGSRVHLNQRDVTFTCVSRASLGKIEAYKRRMGWEFPWASSLGSDFNFDFGVSFTDEQLANGAEYNFGQAGPDQLHDELPGMSCFELDDGVVYHTYSAYARGGEPLMGIYQLLDRAPAGRNEDGFSFPMQWVRRHDEYQRAIA